MLTGAPGAEPLTRVGDSFEMSRDREQLGDALNWARTGC